MCKTLIEITNNNFSAIKYKYYAVSSATIHSVANVRRYVTKLQGVRGILSAPPPRVLFMRPEYRSSGRFQNPRVPGHGCNGPGKTIGFRGSRADGARSTDGCDFATARVESRRGGEIEVRPTVTTSQRLQNRIPPSPTGNPLPPGFPDLTFASIQGSLGQHS